MPFPPPSRRYDDQLFSYDVEMSERLMRMRRAPCLDRGERAADVPLRLGIGMRVNDLAVGRDDIARPAGDLARPRDVDRYLLADIHIIARTDARPPACERELSRAFLRKIGRATG